MKEQEPTEQGVNSWTAPGALELCMLKKFSPLSGPDRSGRGDFADGNQPAPYAQEYKFHKGNFADCARNIFPPNKKKPSLRNSKRRSDTHGNKKLILQSACYPATCSLQDSHSIQRWDRPTRHWRSFLLHPIHCSFRLVN